MHSGRSSSRSTPLRRTSAGNVPKQIRGTDNRVLRVCRLLNRHRVRYLIAGGIAANLHGAARATKDIDVLVPPDPKNMAKLLDALTELPYRVAAELDPDEIAHKPILIVWTSPGCSSPLMEPLLPPTVTPPLSYQVSVIVSRAIGLVIGFFTRI